jgi:hypothetical protein
MKRLSLLCLLVVALMTVAAPTFAQDAISYTSQPDEVAIFYNNIAFARDTVTLPGGTDVAIILPGTVYTDTLVLRENGARVPNYRLIQAGVSTMYNIPSGNVAIQWQSAAGTDAREVTLEYLMSGLSWKPKYDLFLSNTETAGFDFFAEITNNALAADAVNVRLVAGSVGTDTVYADGLLPSANQYAAGYAEVTTSSTVTGNATIQYIYNTGTLSLNPGELAYNQIVSTEVAARKVHLWNASMGNQVTVIYKLLNESDVPFADGVVRSYQDSMFLGSDAIELTPVNSEGSVTVGTLQNVRVNREETVTALNTFTSDTQHDITLTLTNFGEEDMVIDVIDAYPTYSLDFNFNAEPERQGDNQFKWTVTVPAGGEATVTYSYKTS